MGVQSSEIVLDQVVHVHGFGYRGHVYDLQTATGYILAEGLATKNCTWYPWDDRRFRRDEAIDDAKRKKTERELLLERLGRKRHRELARLLPRTFKNKFLPEDVEDAWNPNQPREPAGSPEGGQFASITGGGISGGATGGPAKAPANKLFTPSSDKAHHEKRVSDTLLNPVKRNDNYRYIVGQLVKEAKGHGASVDIIAALRTKIGESFYKQGLVKKEKGAEDQAQSMFAKGKSYGYNPTVGEAMAAMAAPVAKPQEIEPGPSVLPAMQVGPASWETKLEQQKAAVAQAAQPKPTAAELEKAKKVGPFYPVPASAKGKESVAAWNEKWASKQVTDPHELEQKVAEYKAAKAWVEKHEAAAQAEQAAKLKAEQAAAKAKEEAESAAHQAEIAKIAAELGLTPNDADQVDTLISLAGGDKAKIVLQFKSFQESGKGKHGLPITPFESAMIQSYVGSAYGHANRQLREGVWDMKTHVFAAAIQKALTKLPAYNEVLKRGFTAKTTEQSQYEVGKIVHWNAFSSCGKSSSFGGNMQCTITPLAGDKTRARDLGPMNPSEAGGEVLYMAKSSFKVSKVQGSPGGSMHVWLDEVESF